MAKRSSKPGLVVQMTMDDEALQQLELRIKGRFTKAGAAMTRAHSEMIRWLGHEAAKNLQGRMKRRPDPRNDPGLVDILQNPRASVASPEGLNFMEPGRVESISERTAAYYRVIEGRPGATVGSRYWIAESRRRGGLWLGFHGSPGRPQGLPISARVQAGVGGRSQAQPLGGKRTFIDRPVPAYNYAYKARQKFLDEGRYFTFADAELAKIGIVAQRGSGKKSKRR